MKRCVDASQGKPAEDPGTVHRHAERDFQKLFTEMGLSIPIPIQSFEHHIVDPDAKQVTTYHIRPQDWVKHWLDSCPELLGGCNGSPAQNFESFWRMYEFQHPGHEVYNAHRNNLKNVLPLAIHGDEGRSLKKTNYLVVSVESVFGSIEDPRVHAGCSCKSFLASRPDLPSYRPESEIKDDVFAQHARKQLTNFKGHSYLSRWLIFGLGGWISKKHPGVAKKMLELLSQDMTDLFNNGVVLTNGQVVYAAIVGIKGDMDFHTKYSALERSYSNLGRKRAIKMCHLCQAGSESYPFEDYQEDPAWSDSRSMLAERPWNIHQPPALNTIPFDQDGPELALRGDAFHIVKLGVGRDVVGGTLVLLLRKGFFDYPGCSTKIDERFCRAHSSFALWCAAEGKSPGLRSFTKSYFNMTSLISAPWASSKASDTVLLLQWLIWFLKLNISSPVVPGYGPLLDELLQVCQSTIGINILHHHGLWLERDCATTLYVHMMTCLRGYAVLGRRAMTLHVRAFIQKPKHHALHHIAFALKRQLKTSASLILSPQAFSNDVNEDYVGRISRLSRRVSIRLCDLRVCQRLFLKIAALLRQRRGTGAKCGLTKPKHKHVGISGNRVYRRNLKFKRG